MYRCGLRVSLGRHLQPGSWFYLLMGSEKQIREACACCCVNPVVGTGSSMRGPGLGPGRDSYRAPGIVQVFSFPGRRPEGKAMCRPHKVLHRLVRQVVAGCIFWGCGTHMIKDDGFTPGALDRELALWLPCLATPKFQKPLLLCRQGAEQGL